MKRPIVPVLVLVIPLLVAVTLVAGDQASSAAAVESEPVAYLPLVRLDRNSSVFDMAEFIVGDGRLYEVWHSNDSQARHQTQFEGQRFYHTKGIPTAEWEELWMDEKFVYRGTDTSPGDGLYYTLRDGGQYGSRWSPRYWKVGDIFERYPYVTFYQKSDCAIDAEFPQQTWLRFEAYYPTYTLGSGITIREVIVLDWLLSPDGQPAERYFYARDFGLVAWQNSHGDFSYVSEIHPPGSRPDNVREVIACLDNGDRAVPDQPILPLRPYEPPYRAK